MVVIGIYAPFCALTAVIFSIEIFRHYKRQQEYLFTLLCFYALGWYVVNIVGLLAQDEQLAKFCINFMLLFVGLIPPTLLLFIIDFYKVVVRLPKWTAGLLFVIPAINLLMALTAEHHALLNTSLEFTQLFPYREMEIVWGPWFWVHTVYSYIISGTIIALILWQHFRVAHFYRLPSSMMVLGVSITLLGNVTTILQIIPPVIEPTLISMSLSLIFFNLAIINNNTSKFVRFSRAHIYNYLAEYILVLNEKNQIIDFNSAAGDWFTARGITLQSASLESVTEALLQKGRMLHHDSDPEDVRNAEAGVDISIEEGMFRVILNQRIYQMKDVRNDSIGKIVVFSDVTQNRTLIERLEKKAGMDSLTGLANHTAYTGAKKRLDNPEHLPLSVVMCDVNGLKNVNDTMGHEYGDLLLQKAAAALEAACPKSAFVARIGGDEFIYLLPATLPDEACDLTKKVKRQCAAMSGLPFTVSVAMGTATKFSMEESLDALISRADSLMYADKHAAKRRRFPVPAREAAALRTAATTELNEVNA